MTARGPRTRAEANQARSTHGHARKGAVTYVYRCWQNMWSRCTDPNTIGWQYYGGKGITVCARWKKFENFLADMGEPPTPRHTLDRVKTDKDYCRSNCRWATKKEQDNNRTSNRNITFKGRTMTATQWAEELGLKPGTVLRRLNAGWDTTRILTTPVGVKDRPRHPVFLGRRSKIDL